MRLDLSATNVWLQASSWLSGQAPLASTPTSRFSWDEITPAKHFVWHDCNGDWKCARLQVPMDWQGTSAEANRTVEIAVVKLEATVPVTDPTYGGPVILNPGGPGGSGVADAFERGRYIRTILSAGSQSDKSSARNFDIISFDPRGINNTRPLVTCFPNHQDQSAWQIADVARGLVGTSDTSFDNLWAAHRAIGEGCSKRMAEDGFGKHMNTAPVARDIVEIVERHGQWREKEAKRLVEGSTQRFTNQQQEDILQRTKHRKGHESIQYWGFSYGTILGATLSAMYPDRIHRAVLDGVADSFDYYLGGWTTNLPDTDQAFVRLAQHCIDGGPENCALYDKGGSEAVTSNIQRTMANLKHSPISIPGDAKSGPAIVTYNDLMKHIREIVYHPMTEWPTTAQILHDLGQNNGSSLAAWKIAQAPDLGDSLIGQCETDGAYSPACFKNSHGLVGVHGATWAIACSDADPATRVNQSKAEYRKYADQLMADSRLIGGSWAEIMMPCTAWHSPAHWRYEGDFKSKTAHPILFAGNTADPVTPLRNAFHMAGGFDGAGVLHQDSAGHCTYAGVSMCSMRAIREYFQSGKLPGALGGLEGWEKMGKYCDQDRQPLDGYTRGADVPLPKGESDKELWDAVVGLNKAS